MVEDDVQKYLQTYVEPVVKPLLKKAALEKPTDDIAEWLTEQLSNNRVLPSAHGEKVQAIYILRHADRMDSEMGKDKFNAICDAKGLSPSEKWDVPIRWCCIAVT